MKNNIPTLSDTFNKKHSKEICMETEHNVHENVLLLLLLITFFLPIILTLKVSESIKTFETLRHYICNSWTFQLVNQEVLGLFCQGQFKPCLCMLSYTH